MKMYLQHMSTGNFRDAGDYTEQPFAAPVGFQWVVGEPPDGAKKYRPPTLMEVLNNIIEQGQASLKGDPLPSDIERQIYKTQDALQGLYKRGKLNLIKDEINDFAINPARVGNKGQQGKDVTPEQAALVNQLKQAMLAYFQ